MKKKIITVMLITAMSFSVIACGGNKDSSIDKGTNNLESVESVSETESQTEQAKDLYDHISNDEYADMLIKYNDLFMEQMSVLIDQNISTLISENANVSDLLDEISNVSNKLDIADETLSSYFNEFDSDRTKAPMGTKIMRMLSDAQSAITQYGLAIDYLNDYITYKQDQEYLDKSNKYFQKVKDSLDDYNEVLTSEKAALGI